MKLVLTSLVLKSFHNHNNFKENTPTSRDEKYHFKEKKNPILSLSITNIRKYNYYKSRIME